MLADQGVLCIDEIDKNLELHRNLRDAMERQKVSIIKMGMRCNADARATIICAGNPVQSYYEVDKSFTKNVRIDTAFMSRFDLIFILRGTPEWNHHYADWVRHNGNPDPRPTTNELERFLMKKKNEKINPLPAVLFQKYITFARKHCRPTVPDEVARYLEEFYYELRWKYWKGEMTVTLR